MAAIFVAQALGVELTLTQEITLLAVAMLTSKGASGVTGAGFITLAATLHVVPAVPVAGLALILGIDRFMITPLSAAWAFSSGSSSSCRITGWSLPSISPEAMRNSSE